MSTIFDCNTPKEGLSLYAHNLSNSILEISILVGRNRLDQSTPPTDEARSKAHAAKQALVVHLYIVMRRMQFRGHHSTAERMLEIVDMAAMQNLADDDVSAKINAKQKELEAFVASLPSAPSA